MQRCLYEALGVDGCFLELAPGGCDLLRAQPIPAPLCLPGSIWPWSCALVSLRSEEPAAGLGWVSHSGLQTACPVCQGGLNSAPVPGVTAALLSSSVLGFTPSCSFCKAQPRRTLPLRAVGALAFFPFSYCLCVFELMPLNLWQQSITEIPDSAAAMQQENKELVFSPKSLPYLSFLFKK